MIKKESIENLKNYLDVVDVISQFLDLKKSGANFKACCPFHGEDTPSFVVSPTKQIYHCFGCGVGGDSIKFLMEYEKLSYPETIEKLASMYNFTLSYDDSNQKIKDTKVIEAVKNFFQNNFSVNEAMKEYVRNRGISDFSAEKFEIGYASSSNDTVNFVKSNHYNINDAIEFGIIDNGENGLYSRFIERVIFPIYSITGKLVGFGGRTTTNHNAKYINSPQTPIFNKSKLLYGYHLAKERIYKSKEIIVCEGYLDVIMLHQARFNNAVATLGTALTKEHIPLLRRGEPKVILAYDGDNAGQNAAFKASVMLSQNGFDGGVVIFKGGLDPADMVKNQRNEELHKMFLEPINFINFAIDFIVSQFNINEPIQKQKALDQANEYLQSLSELNQDEYRRYIAQKLNIRENLIKVSNTSRRTNETSRVKIDIAELCIIRSILDKPQRLDMVLDIIDTTMFEFHQEEFLILLEDINDTRLNQISLNDKLEIYDDDRLKKELLILLYKYYSNKLLTIKYKQELNNQEKTAQIIKIRDKLELIKKGKLPSSL